MRVLMVCLGNICRSPMAEGVLKQLVMSRGYQNWIVDSAGIGDWHAGDLPDKRAIKTALKNGIDIRDQRARQIRASDLQSFDHILAMDLENLQAIKLLAGASTHHANVQLLLHYKYPNQNRSVPDPYYTNLFDESYQLITEGCTAFLDQYSIP